MKPAISPARVFSDADQRDFAEHKQYIQGALARMNESAVDAVRLGQRLVDVQRRELYLIDGCDRFFPWVREAHGIGRSQAKIYLTLGRGLRPEDVAGRGLIIKAMYEIAQASRVELRQELLDSGATSPAALRAGRSDAERVQRLGEPLGVMLEAARAGIARGAPVGQKKDEAHQADAALRRLDGLLGGVVAQSLAGLEQGLERLLNRVRERREATQVATPVAAPVTESALVEVASPPPPPVVPMVEDPPPPPPAVMRPEDRMDHALAVWVDEVRRARTGWVACLLPVLMVLGAAAGGVAVATQVAAAPEGLIEGEPQGSMPRTDEEAVVIKSYYRHQELLDEGRTQEAIAALERTVVLAGHNFPAGHPYPGDLRCELGRLYLDAGQTQRALTALAVGIERYDAGLHNVDADAEWLLVERRRVMSYRHDQVRALHRLGHLEDAEALLRRMAAESVKLSPPGDELRVQVATALRVVLQARAGLKVVMPAAAARG